MFKLVEISNQKLRHFEELFKLQDQLKGISEHTQQHSSFQSITLPLDARALSSVKSENLLSIFGSISSLTLPRTQNRSVLKWTR